ncbi:MAG: hypothetical protein PHW53_02435 [Patescibacteria group bacterium]|nr:hypothetical protein [Patescibacteria group bacterium]
MPEITKITHEVPEFIKHERSLLWYIVAFLIAGGLVTYAILSGNFLFAVIVVLIGVIIVLTSFREPRKLSFEIDPMGVAVGGKRYKFTDFKDFSIIYNPPETNTLYLEFRMPLRERLSVQLGDMDPNEVREYLMNFLKEDLEREQESLSDILSRLLKF